MDNSAKTILMSVALFLAVMMAIESLCFVLLSRNERQKPFFIDLGAQRELSGPEPKDYVFDGADPLLG